MSKGSKPVLALLACACFAIAVLRAAAILTIDARIDWTDLGLLLGFLSIAS